MREIRTWQSIYVSVINRLPYPVFLAIDGNIKIWNMKASGMLGEHSSADIAMSKAVGSGVSGTGSLDADDAGAMGFGTESSSQGDSQDTFTVPIPDIQQLVAKYCRSNDSVSQEVVLNGREHILLCVPYPSLDTALGPAAAEEHVSHLVCLVDIADVKERVTHDKQALRHIAHDLRSPLTAILTLIEERATYDRVDNSGNEHLFLDDLRRQADYSLRVAQDFLQLSRAEQIDRQAFAPVILEDIAAEAIDYAWSAAEKKSIQVIGPECSVENTMLMGNADMLIRTIVNVIDNAIKYSPPHTSIKVRLVDVDQKHMALHIVDEGMGIAEDDLQRLFDPFFQVVTQGEAEAGVGLGLPFVKTVIERHGGSVNVQSAPGIGTDFKIVLPRH